MRLRYLIIGIILFLILFSITGYFLIKSKLKSSRCNLECDKIGLERCYFGEGSQICGNYDDNPCLKWGEINICDEKKSCMGGECIPISSIELKEASILTPPLRKDMKCWWMENKNLEECSKFYKEDKFGGKIPACPYFYNPVYDSEGIFYPSLCWAKHFGVSDYHYGYSNKMVQFIIDLWHIPSVYEYSSTELITPDIEFSFQGSGLVGFKSGVFFRSCLWKNSTNLLVMDYNIDTKITIYEFENRVTKDEVQFINPVYGGDTKILLVFVLFDNAYPEQILLEWTPKYEKIMNDYIRKKQEVKNPIQYNIVPIVISPPEGVERKSQQHQFFSEEENEKIYNEALKKTSQKEFQILAISPIIINGAGGYYQKKKDIDIVVAPLSPHTIYSSQDKRAILDTLFAFQDMFGTLHHELLHSLGLSGDHQPGNIYLEVANTFDPLTGEEEGYISQCDFLGTSKNYYVLELPEDIKIKVGQEPSWMNPGIIVESSSGNCYIFDTPAEMLKDFDKDGEYEIMYNNYMIGVELQRALGWVDIDGDGLPEISDTTPYGGYKQEDDFFCPSGCELYSYLDMCNCRGRTTQVIGPFSLEPIGEVMIKDCKFEKVKLSNGDVGLVPLKCMEFNQEIVNLYKEVNYHWIKIEKEYGTVLIPRFF